MGDHDRRSLVGAERGLELLDRLEVEVVRGLVEDEAVDAERHQLGQVGARALAGGQRRAGSVDVVGAEVELGEQRARLARLEPGAAR